MIRRQLDGPRQDRAVGVDLQVVDYSPNTYIAKAMLVAEGYMFGSYKHRKARSFFDVARNTKDVVG